MSHLLPPNTPDHEVLKILAGPAVKATIDGWLVPAVKKLFESKPGGSFPKPEEFQKVFSEYLLRTYARLSFMNTIVFGNQQKRLQDLYIPLTVRATGSNEESFKIDQWREDFLPAFKRVVITDTAGMGKSTILKWLFLCSLGNDTGIPLFIELRTLSASKSILEKIHDELCSIDKPFNKEMMLQLLKAGKFIFFLDGFDEVAFEDRGDVTRDIQEFIGKAFDNLFIIASRHETALASFGEFREFTIKPLNKNEAYELLRKYDESGEHAEALIAELEAAKYEQLKDLMVNPMLVSLLFKAYSYKPKVPFKKQIFYRQVYDALYDMHDSTKGGAFVRQKQSNLDIDEFHQVMRDLGFTTAKLGKIEYEKDEVSSIIKKIRERNDTILFSPTALLSDLVTTVPLFNKEGAHYKWAHKSVQDYFASQFIALDAKGNEASILEKIYDRGHCRRFENILDMLHDTDNKTFRRSLLARLLRDYITHYESSYRGKFDGISDEMIGLRRQLSFGFEMIFEFLPAASRGKLRANFPPRSVTDDVYADLFSRKARPDLMMWSAPGGAAVCQAVLFKPPYGLLPLLVARKYSYIEKVSHVRMDLEGLPAKGRFVLTDDPQSPLNSPKMFGNINEMLKHSGYLINIDQARRTLISIEEDTREASDSSYLLDDL